MKLQLFSEFGQVVVPELVRLFAPGTETVNFFCHSQQMLAKLG